MTLSWTADELGQLLDRHGPALRLFAAQWTTAPDDCVQEALLALLRQTQRPQNVVAWLYRVIRNQGLSQRRSRLRRQRHELDAGSLAPSWFEPQVAGELDGRLAAEALAQLAFELREVVIARIWGGLSYEEIGEILGTSRSGAHRRYHEALAALREKLGIALDQVE